MIPGSQGRCFPQKWPPYRYVSSRPYRAYTPTMHVESVQLKRQVSLVLLGLLARRTLNAARGVGLHVSNHACSMHLGVRRRRQIARIGSCNIARGPMPCGTAPLSSMICFMKTGWTAWCGLRGGGLGLLRITVPALRI